MLRQGSVLLIGLLMAAQAQAQSGAAAEREAVRQAILDYVEAIYQMQPERIARSVHPTLAKRGYQIPRDSARYREYPMTYTQLEEVARTFNRNGQVPANAPKQIDIFEVLDQTASAKLTAMWGIDYFHLAKYDGKWKIVNVLWQAPPRPPAPARSPDDSADQGDTFSFSLSLTLPAVSGTAESDNENESENVNSVASRQAQTAAPERVLPGVISTDRNETFPAIDPVDGSLWFSVYADNFDRQTIRRAARSGTGWGAPAAVPFSPGQWGDRAPRFSPDGQRLYISSNRPTPANAAGGDFNLWVLERRANSWSEPRLLPEPVNSTGRDYHSSETRAGELYFASTRPGGAGRGDVYRTRRNGAQWSAPEALGAPINDALSQPDLLVAPDGTWMILVITDHPQGLGGDDLFVSRFENGKWSALKHLPAPINSNEYEYGPSLSPDGRTLYFTSHRGGSADVYRISVTALGITSR